MLVGDLVVLRDESRPEDDADLNRWLQLEEWNYYDEPDVPFAAPTAGLDEYLAQRHGRQDTPRAGGHTWQVDTGEGRHIGFANYYCLDEQAKKAHVGICLPEPENWCHGYGTEAVSLLVDYLFRVMGLNEVHTTTWCGNQRMLRCAAKCGFVEVGRRPHNSPVSVRGEPLERVEFAMTRERWLARHGG